MAPARANALPAGVHVAFGSDPTTSLTVAWHVRSTTVAEGWVEWGIGSEELDRRADARRIPAPGAPSTLFETTLGGALDPGATVFYRACIEDGCAPVRRTATAPVTDSFRFAAFADHGRKATSQRTTALVADTKPAMVLMPGDLSYANANLPAWDDWFEQIEPLAGEVPLMVAPGNHETDPSQTPTPAAYGERFALPGAEFYYSFDYGRAHFLMVHSTVSAAARHMVLPDMLQFMEQDLLGAAQRKRSGALDWIFVVQHHPLYGSQDSSAPSKYLERNYNTPLIALEERMFHQYGVDVLIAGHNHQYERSRPMAYGQATNDSRNAYRDAIGFVQVITGGGGQSLYEFMDPADVQPWSVVRKERFHYTEFTIEGKKLTARAIATDDAAGEVLDQWTLQRS